MASIESLLKNGFSSPAILIPLLALCSVTVNVFKNVLIRIKKTCISDSVEAKIRFGNSTTRVNLLIDSGNLAKEPFTGKRIIILGRRASKHLFIPDTSKRYLVNLKSAVGESIQFAYAPDEILFNHPNIYKEEFLIMTNTDCDDFAGFDGLSPTLKTR